MASNYDYITMLNLPELSPPTASESEFQNELDLWLNTDFSFDPLDSSAFSGDSRRPEDFEYDHSKEAFPERAGAGATARVETQAQHSSQTSVQQQAPTTSFTQSEAIATIVPQVAHEAPAISQYHQPVLAPMPVHSNPTLPNTTSGFSVFGTDAASTIGASNLTLQQIIAAAAAMGANTTASASQVSSEAAMNNTSTATSVPESDVAKSEDRTDEELDKRRRNTAASARFRAKKKLREQALERTAKEMTEKAQQLERRVKEYEMELKWLRQLVTDREGKKRLRDFYEESGLTFIEGTMAAGCGIESQGTTSNVPAANLAAAAAAFAGVMALAGKPLALPLPPDNKRRRAA
ncbi:uncharacterized protein SPPG_06898 [Spizellomyces punctatus DAOM BR117]|uniref:BZIP domain-containing protein n=1 Tax=Spizellomyces punctatus (strain DAOM BR117) TaxID=645134 RepID=A0A0L0H9N9_SPIPD|nr:uncharacterized protein SPPG_06898 [Spizellomyces punctatus DAOM BR117]KNC97907.1 hypothetical protein SPPG_06898 [Spizellomyces punctatus DAOM BR117]|eukprot:XP_016605947.1 hypothetical protein SPPG_06898 [Spizellomyces punctatus DAOM BR117]